MSTKVLLSGWAMPARIFEPLQQHDSIQAIGLPGITPWKGVNSTDDICWSVLVKALDNQLPKQSIELVGWSLGGLLAMKYAELYPEKIKSLVLMGCNPSFVQKTDWPCAMSCTLFKRFTHGMVDNPNATLKKFMFLCSQGAKNNKLLLKQLKQLLIFSNALIDLNLMTPMLELLSDDLRSTLANIQCPVHHIFAKHDNLVPVNVVNAISHHYPQHQVTMVEGGHAFFYENPAAIASILNGAKQELTL